MASASNESKNSNEKDSAKKRMWSVAEEKQLLTICSDIEIAEQLDNCVTSASNEGVYLKICEGLVEAGFEERETFKIREKYRKLKTKYHDVRLHNLKATGRDRKIWHLYDLADSVWGHRPVAARKPIDTDTDMTGIADGEISFIDDKEDDAEPSKAKMPKKESKLVVKFGRNGGAKRGVNAGDSDNYLIDKLVELEEKRLENEMKLQRERMEADKASREAQMQFQRDIMTMMLQTQQPYSHSAQFPLVHAPHSLFEPQFTHEKEPANHPGYARSLYDLN